MIESVERMMKTLSQFGMSIEYRVMKPSKNPAAIVNGMVLKKILKLFLKPVLREFILEYVRGNRMEAPRINPAADSITIPKISIEP